MAPGRLPPAHLAACGCTQIGQIRIGSTALVPKQDRRQIGGFARGYQGIFVPLAALRSSGYGSMDGHPAVYLYIAAL
jgi:hypothetical protein